MNKRILQAQMDLSVAYVAIKRAESEALKDKQAVPRWLLDQLQSNLKLAKGNLFQATIAEEAMRKYPPL